ncbi:G patch domain-containing protein 11 isoform X1 [Cotesia glomerata]|nr:G patch domain-containing protein 11 isoform X1 [Cotesia glomerata]
MCFLFIAAGLRLVSISPCSSCLKINLPSGYEASRRFMFKRNFSAHVILIFGSMFFKMVVTYFMSAICNTASEIMSDEDDYMSDKFLESLQQNANKSSSSLIYKQSEKRRLEVAKRKAEHDARVREKNKSSRVMEKELRDKQMSEELTSDNKGFEMLMKMGYKPGQGIGKNLHGSSEPIPINIKSDRSGLGKSNNSSSINKKKINPTAKLESMKTEDFRDRIAMKKLQQLLEIDLFKSQKVCEQLDTKSGINEPVELWYWPKVEKEKKSDEENEDGDENKDDEDDNEDDDTNEIPAAEKLQIINKYLRDKYFYCIWCGTDFNDGDDLADNCPGDTRSDH